MVEVRAMLRVNAGVCLKQPSQTATPDQGRSVYSDVKLSNRYPKDVNSVSLSNVAKISIEFLQCWHSGRIYRVQNESLFHVVLDVPRFEKNAAKGSPRMHFSGQNPMWCHPGCPPSALYLRRWPFNFFRPRPSSELKHPEPAPAYWSHWCPPVFKKKAGYVFCVMKAPVWEIHLRTWPTHARLIPY